MEKFAALKQCEKVYFENTCSVQFSLSDINWTDQTNDIEWYWGIKHIHGNTHVCYPATKLAKNIWVKHRSHLFELPRWPMADNFHSFRRPVCADSAAAPEPRRKFGLRDRVQAQALVVVFLLGCVGNEVRLYSRWEEYWDTGRLTTILSFEKFSTPFWGEKFTNFWKF